MKRLKDATEKDIEEMRRRLMYRKERRILDQDVEEVINIVNKRREYCAGCGVIVERRLKCYT